MLFVRNRCVLKLIYFMFGKKNISSKKASIFFINQLCQSNIPVAIPGCRLYKNYHP